MPPVRFPVAVAAACLALCALSASSAPAPKNRVARGKYLVTITHCNDCHTPFKMGPNGPEPDMTRMLSGHPQDVKLPPPPQPQGPWVVAGYPSTAWAGPWGISYSVNLTPDKTTGLGATSLWSEELFIKAMRTGKHFGTSRPILPPMPWQNVAQMTDEDLRAMWTYLKSIPPIKNQVPDAVLAPPPPAK
ncbi:MAG TPA: diheme cytochrome c-553 [Thermoanaerobaculia bacterium]|nr:diheme cytochrome c-553 [Thermoanaerobaculia bacterium]